ncbi:MAG TPA: hypothetical protein VL068_02480, partial [Microthrixaceae bacterium]|nr:hypothetical protein [Microthrixaceae bacterium]
SDGTVSVDERHLLALGEEFDAARVDGEGAASVIREIHSSLGLIIDPHTAVAVAAAERSEGDPSVPVVALATADPAKFPDAVEMAIGIRPPLPERLGDLFERAERITKVEGNLGAVEELILSTLDIPAGPAS